MRKSKSFGGHTPLLLIAVLAIAMMMLPVVFTDMDNQAESNGVEDGNYADVYGYNIKINTMVQALIIMMIIVLFVYWVLQQVTTIF